MATLYPGTSVSGYDANPPPDDGSTGSTNLITWAGIKSKLGDPLNTFAVAIDSNLTAAFGKTLDGASVVKTGVNYAMTAADQGRLIVATASGITITTPDAGTVGAPFEFAINNQSTGTVTLAGNATNSQTVDGQTTQSINVGAGGVVKTDGTNWFTYGLKSAQITSGANPPYGFDAPINLQLNASVASSILTIAVKANNGNDPTTSNPVLIPFRDATNANGDPVWVSVTSALSINTNAIGATLGTQSGNVPFRFWILAFNNAGTVVLALFHPGAGSSTPVITPLAEWSLFSTTGISSAATSAGTYYTPNGINLSSCAFRIIGFLEYSSGLLTAGTYNIVPTRLQLFGPGIKKPGDVVQKVFNSTSSGSAAIQPTSSINLVQVLSGIQGAGSTSATIAMTLKRGATSLNTQTFAGGSGTYTQMPFGFVWLDNPQTTSSTTYSISGSNMNPNSATTMILDEIMG